MKAPLVQELPPGRERRRDEPLAQRSQNKRFKSTSPRVVVSRLEMSSTKDAIVPLRSSRHATAPDTSPSAKARRPASANSQTPRGESALSNPSLTIALRAHWAALRHRGMSGVEASGS